MSDENSCFTRLIERIYRGAFLSGFWPAALLVGARAEIVFANPAAQKMLSVCDGLSLCKLHGIARWQLRANQSSVQATIDAALRLVVQPAGAATSFFPLITVQRTSEAAHYVLRFAKLPSMDIDIGFCSENMPLAIVFITDTTLPLALEADTLTRLFGLTASEARLAIVLGDGIALKQAANMLGVSLNTVKTQLQQVYLKSGVASRARLMKLLAALARGGV